MTPGAFVSWQRRFGAAGIGALDRIRALHDRRGTLGRRERQEIAVELRWPVAAATGSTSFYADLHGEVRSRHVQVCTGTSCFVSTGGRPVARAESALADAGRQRAGATSSACAHCLGFCYAAPAVLDGATPLAGPGVYEGLGSDTRDPAPALPFRSECEPVVLSGLVGGEPAWQVWPEAVVDGSDAVLGEVGAAGLRGRGGAEFPVAAKWRAARRGRPPRYVVANGDEGDPGSFCDRLLMEGDPHRVLEGLALAGLAVGARRGFAFVRSEYPEATRILRDAVAEARAAGHLGLRVHGSAVDFDVEIVRGAGSYVAGEETALLRALQGLRGGVLPRPPYPTERGVRHQPTAVNNVETLAAVPWILRHGASAYARLGTEREPGTKLVCFSERFRAPGVCEVEFGAPLRHLVDGIGGGLRDGHRLRAVQVGGPLGGFLAPHELDVPLTAHALADAGVALGHGSLVAIDDAVRARDLLQHVWSFAASESCGACAPCRIGTRQGSELTAAGDVDAQRRVLDVMARASLCGFGRGVPGAVRSLLRTYREELGGRSG
ncbi:NADH-ubiquinone oxidoreductase-F iron-sulfur binding region domain-containing protein [Saccharopolyspora sp. MS10]|uniref:NADH-ubiquinone oxidoreductase-F iron-sulfur binding region domain-containing protein n=1 Tax=Saccharopolyspora sp. MS10 TaxID=3385973 RepID=UPI0039A0AECC